MADTTPRVVVYDVAVLQCELLAKGLTALDTGFDVVCVCDSASLLKCLSSGPNWIVLISDVNPHSDSLAIAKDLNKLFPGLIFIVMIQAGRQDRMIAAFKSGAKGVISSDTTLPQLAKCIYHVSQGEVWVGRRDLSVVLDVLVGSTTQLVDADSKKLLTPREEEVAGLVAEGLSNRDISNTLKISESTVKNYVFHIFDKLGVSNRVELTRYLNRAS
jgi:DNA-binding NarL/FixJ family response regulator